MEKCTLVSVTGNFLTMALIAGSRALSVKKPGLDFESEHALKIKKKNTETITQTITTYIKGLMPADRIQITLYSCNIKHFCQISNPWWIFQLASVKVEEGIISCTRSA